MIDRRRRVWSGKSGRSRDLLLAALLALGLTLWTGPNGLARLLPNDGDRGDSPAAATALRSAAPTDDPSLSARRLPPALETVEPTGGDAPVSAAIVATFSQPMSRSSVEGSFAVYPLVDGAFTWQDDFTFRFQPIRFAHGVTYRVQVGGRSLRGSQLVGERAWQFTTIAGPAVVHIPGPSALRVPILMYHYIRVNPDWRDRLGHSLSVTPADFAAQMDWLARSGYHTITIHELESFLNGSAGLPSRPIILTFDDGYADFYANALPVLIRYDFRAVSYVVSGFVGRPGYMTAAEIQKADRAGIEIGSHTVDHVNLTRQSADSLGYQLTASRQALEQLVGHPVTSFCYPSGRFNSVVVAAVQAAGYSDATTTQLGSLRTLGSRYTWGRLRISGGESLPVFARDVQAFS